MTQENKELLLRDLSARLPYGVMCNIGLKYPLQLQRIFVDRLDGILLDFYEDGNDYQVYLSEVKPYLRIMSSMTEEEKRHISKMMCLRTYDDGVVHDMTYPVYTPYYVMEDCLSYLRSIHVDYSGLIEKDLALAAPEGMYEY